MVKRVRSTSTAHVQTIGYMSGIDKEQYLRAKARVTRLIMCSILLDKNDVEGAKEILGALGLKISETELCRVQQRQTGPPSPSP